MFSKVRFVKATLRKYEECVNLLDSHEHLWPTSAPVGVPVGSWKFTWSWKLLGSGRELELELETELELEHN